MAVETAAVLFWSGHLFCEDKRQVYEDMYKKSYFIHGSYDPVFYEEKRQGNGGSS